jgi:cytochrome c oxidase subunit 2
LTFVDLADPYAQDDIVVTELHSKRQKNPFQDAFSRCTTAYMPYFRAQMNCVPGMVTQFAFEPIYTTDEYRELPFMVSC